MFTDIKSHSSKVVKTGNFRCNSHLGHNFIIRLRTYLSSPNKILFTRANAEDTFNITMNKLQMNAYSGPHIILP